MFTRSAEGQSPQLNTQGLCVRQLLYMEIEAQDHRIKFTEEIQYSPKLRLNTFTSVVLVFLYCAQGLLCSKLKIHYISLVYSGVSLRSVQLWLLNRSHILNLIVHSFSGLLQHPLCPVPAAQSYTVLILRYLRHFMLCLLFLNHKL